MAQNSFNKTAAYRWPGIRRGIHSVRILHQDRRHCQGCARGRGDKCHRAGLDPPTHATPLRLPYGLDPVTNSHVLVLAGTKTLCMRKI